MLISIKNALNFNVGKLKLKQNTNKKNCNNKIENLIQ